MEKVCNLRRSANKSRLDLKKHQDKLKEIKENLRAVVEF